jgi:hypothetical protein
MTANAIQKTLHDYFVFEIGCRRNLMNPDLVRAQFSLAGLAKVVERSIGEVALSQPQVNGHGHPEQPASSLDKQGRSEKPTSKPQVSSPSAAAATAAATKGI